MRTAVAWSFPRLAAAEKSARVAVGCRARAAFTLVEMMASMAASIIVVGGLLVSAIAIQRVLNGSDKFAGYYSDQRRLIDYISRDLRRAVIIETTDADGRRAPATSGAVALAGRSSLILSLPGYYQSNAKGGAGFQEALEVVGTAQRLDYGTKKGLAKVVEVRFRQVDLGPGGGPCFVREEGGTQEIIVARAEDLSIEVSIAPEARAALITASFRGTYGAAAPLVSTFDRVLLRNPALDLRP